MKSYFIHNEDEGYDVLQLVHTNDDGESIWEEETKFVDFCFHVINFACDLLQITSCWESVSACASFPTSTILPASLPFCCFASLSSVCWK